MSFGDDGRPASGPRTMDAVDVSRVLPHRYPFLLIDRILQIDSGKMAVGMKAVTVNEPFFQGHFPGHPIMPAVLITEAMAQVGGVLLLSVSGNEGKLAYFAGIDHQRFRKPVMPGDLLVMRVDVTGVKGHIGKVRAEAYVFRLETADWDRPVSASESPISNNISRIHESGGDSSRVKHLFRGVMDGELAAEGELMFALVARDERENAKS